MNPPQSSLTFSTPPRVLLARRIQSLKPYFQHWNLADVPIHEENVVEILQSQIPTMSRSNFGLPLRIGSAAHPSQDNVPGRMVATSGTSGDPVSFFRSDEEARFESRQLRRLWTNWIGERDRPIREGVLRARANRDGTLAMETRSPGRVNLWCDLRGDYLTAFPDLFETFQEFQPDIIRGYGSLVHSYVLWLQNKRLNHHSVHLFAYSSDEMTVAERSSINASVPLVALYGQTERVAMAYSIGDTDVWHSIPDYGFIEILDDRGAPVVGTDSFGEIVATSLFDRSTPFVRYRTGDFARWADYSSPLGLGPQKMTRLQGRVIPELIDRAGTPFAFSRDWRDLITQDLPAGDFVQICQFAPGSLSLRYSGRAFSFTKRTDAVMKELRKAFLLQVNFGSPPLLTPAGKRNVFVSLL